jgi:uncharacterized Zn finger protein
MKREILGKVKGSGSKWYSVSYEHETMKYQCACPAWTHKSDKVDCKHIQQTLIPALLNKPTESVFMLNQVGESFKVKLLALLAQSGMES